ncbi:hypothetical protein BBK36DRAFT_1163941 [Trichoderma citrinoviride]|uniref:Uncharacterized protein n=1 Tax=Trichoderma citrinoviride TaxID=58853 RepID=A0A2T4AWR6_9HYPO|nr:hypothetical protein BBK36DRAFT_1163941 [Trichoderma citrinoviride]PTB61500.1 hypothetical protein BBK36DRAFT_1163941 [Trichoderma citrinoviride]
MGHSEDPPILPRRDTSSSRASIEVAQQAVDFTKQSEKLSHQALENASPAIAVQADFITPRDPVIVTSDGNRLPGVPLEEAHKLNVLREELQGQLDNGRAKKQAEASESAEHHQPMLGGERQKEH